MNDRRVKWRASDVVVVITTWEFRFARLRFIIKNLVYFRCWLVVWAGERDCCCCSDFQFCGVDGDACWMNCSGSWNHLLDWIVSNCERNWQCSGFLERAPMLCNSCLVGFAFGVDELHGWVCERNPWWFFVALNCGCPFALHNFVWLHLSRVRSWGSIYAIFFFFSAVKWMSTTWNSKIRSPGYWCGPACEDLWCYPVLSGSDLSQFVLCVRYAVLFGTFFLFSTFYWSDLCLQICVALADLWWNINKNQIEIRLTACGIAQHCHSLIIKLFVFFETQTLSVPAEGKRAFSFGPDKVKVAREWAQQICIYIYICLAFHFIKNLTRKLSHIRLVLFCVLRR